jgi:hypothetical protein
MVGEVKGPRAHVSRAMGVRCAGSRCAHEPRLTGGTLPWHLAWQPRLSHQVDSGLGGCLLPANRLLHKMHTPFWHSCEEGTLSPRARSRSAPPGAYSAAPRSMSVTGATSLGAGGDVDRRPSTRPITSPTPDPSVGGREEWPPAEVMWTWIARGGGVAEEGGRRACQRGCWCAWRGDCAEERVLAVAIIHRLTGLLSRAAKRRGQRCWCAFVRCGPGQLAAAPCPPPPLPGADLDALVALLSCAHERKRTAVRRGDRGGAVRGREVAR